MSKEIISIILILIGALAVTLEIHFQRKWVIVLGVIISSSGIYIY